MSYRFSDRRQRWPPGRTTFRRVAPPPPPPEIQLPSHNFTLLLLRNNEGGSTSIKEIKDLISTCPIIPLDFFVLSEGPIAAKLFFQHWFHALDAIEFFWRRRLADIHPFIPTLICRIYVSSERDELTERLRAIFMNHINGLLEGDLVRRMGSRIEEVNADVKKVVKSLSRPMPWEMNDKLREDKKGLEEELGLLKDRVEEFWVAMRCLIGCLEGKEKVRVENGEVEIFRFGVEIDWGRIHRVILRECQRFSSGLPIYSCRREILRGISSNQVLLDDTVVF